MHKNKLLKWKSFNLAISKKEMYGIYFILSRTSLDLMCVCVVNHHSRVKLVIFIDGYVYIYEWNVNYGPICFDIEWNFQSKIFFTSADLANDNDDHVYRSMSDNHFELGLKRKREKKKIRHTQETSNSGAEFDIHAVLRIKYGKAKAFRIYHVNMYIWMVDAKAHTSDSQHTHTEHWVNESIAYDVRAHTTNGWFSISRILLDLCHWTPSTYEKKKEKVSEKRFT